MGIFSKRKLVYEGPASPPLAFESAQPIVPMGQMPDIQTPSLPAQKQGFFGQGGFGRYLAGALGDALARNAGMGTPFMDAMQQRQRAEYDDELYQRRSAQDWAKFVRQHEYELAHPAPRYFEANNGDQYVTGAAGKPQLVFKDPTPKVNWVRADNGDGTFTMVPMQMGGEQGQPQSNLPAIGSIIPDPRKGGAGSPAPRNFP